MIILLIIIKCLLHTIFFLFEEISRHSGSLFAHLYSNHLYHSGSCGFHWNRRRKWTSAENSRPAPIWGKSEKISRRYLWDEQRGKYQGKISVVRQRIPLYLFKSKFYHTNINQAENFSTPNHTLGRFSFAWWKWQIWSTSRKWNLDESIFAVFLSYNTYNNRFYFDHRNLFN